MNPINENRTYNGIVGFLACILWLVFFCLFTGCSHDDRPHTDPSPPVQWIPSENDLAVIETLSQAATGLVLQFSITDAGERKIISNQIYAAASGVYTLSGGKVPTAEEFRKYVLAFGGDEATADYVGFVSSLSALYQTYYSRIRGDPETALKVLNAIARGVSASAGAYIH